MALRRRTGGVFNGQTPAGSAPAPRSQTSLTLLQRVRANDQDAWTRLVAIYSPLVSWWCVQSGVTSDEADDLVQEVFQAAFAGLPNFRRDRPGDTFRGWLRGIARNTVRFHFRRTGAQPRGAGGEEGLRQLAEIADPETAAAPEDPPAQIGQLYHRALDLVRCEFEERTWQMFWLTLIEGRDAADVAAELQVTPAAVRKAKSRILHRLKVEIGDLPD
jgi:RNA polymerase sigma-70 factor (ECF subfamily)